VTTTTNEDTLKVFPGFSGCKILKYLVMVSMVGTPEYSCVEILPNVIILRGGTFER
jgi:hypothetical protein